MIGMASNRIADHVSPQLSFVVVMPASYSAKGAEDARARGLSSKAAMV